jgi:hypothetical protein
MFVLIQRGVVVMQDFEAVSNKCNIIRCKCVIKLCN